MPTVTQRQRRICTQVCLLPEPVQFATALRLHSYSLRVSVFGETFGAVSGWAWSAHPGFWFQAPKLPPAPLPTQGQPWLFPLYVGFGLSLTVVTLGKLFYHQEPESPFGKNDGGGPRQWGGSGGQEVTRAGEGLLSCQAPASRAVHFELAHFPTPNMCAFAGLLVRQPQAFLCM